LIGGSPSVKNSIGKIIPRIEYNKRDSTWFEVVFPDKFGVISFNNRIEPIIIKDGHFIGKISNKRVRFFGTTIGWDFLKAPDSIMEKAVRYIKSLGINCVRIHPVGIWNHKFNKFNEEHLERLDYLVKNLRENGIYYSFYSPIYCVYAKQYNLPLTLFKGKALLDEELIIETKKFWESLLTHKNKYTGIRYLDDPALAFLIMTNENSISKLWYQNGGIEILKPYWKNYLEQKKLPYTEIPHKRTDKNFVTFLKFAAEKDSIYFVKMKKFLRSLGVKVPIACTNNPYSYYEQKVFYKISDFMAVHTYGYYSAYKRGGWEKNKSQLFWENGIPGDFPTRMLTVNYLGKPVIVDEWNKGYPINSRIEATILVPCLAGLYDYDGVFYFSFFGHYKYLMNPMEYKKYYMTSLEQPFSIQSIFLPSISYAFRKFLMPVYLDSSVVNINNPEDFLPILFRYRFNPFPGVYKKIYYLKKVIISLDEGESRGQIEGLFKKNDMISTPFLYWDYRKGYAGIHSDKFDAFIGEIEGSFHSQKIDLFGKENFVSVVALSLDGLALPKSKKILITVGSDAINKGEKIFIPAFQLDRTTTMYWFPSKELQLKSRRVPAVSFFKPVNITISIKREEHSEIEIYSLDSNGETIDKIPVRWEDNNILIEILTKIHRSCYYLLESR